MSEAGLGATSSAAEGSVGTDEPGAPAGVLSPSAGTARPGLGDRAGAGKAKRDRDTTARTAHRRRFGPLLVLAVLLVLGVWSAAGLDIRPDRLSGITNLLQLMRESFPPDVSLLGLAFRAIVETLQIAFLGTLLGTVFSLPLGLFGSRNLFGRTVSVPARLLLAGIRTLPALLWAVVFVVAVGLGPLAGVLASGMYTIGYLGKLQYEAIEGIDPAPIHAITAAGASKGQLIRYVVLPESANHLLSQVLFMFEHNVRASSIFGFVGAGGIGFYIAGYLTVFRYQSVLTLLIAVFLTILVIDYLSVKVRDRYLVPAQVRQTRRSASDEDPRPAGAAAAGAVE